MKGERTCCHSPSANKEMPLAVYEHYGFAHLLMSATATG